MPDDDHVQQRSNSALLTFIDMTTTKSSTINIMGFTCNQKPYVCVASTTGQRLDVQQKVTHLLTLQPFRYQQGISVNEPCTCLDNSRSENTQTQQYLAEGNPIDCTPSPFVPSTLMNYDCSVLFTYINYSDSTFQNYVLHNQEGQKYQEHHHLPVVQSCTPN